jgi:hypothetical protein
MGFYLYQGMMKEDSAQDGAIWCSDQLLFLFIGQSRQPIGED